MYHRKRKSSTRGEPSFFLKKAKKLGVLSPLKFITGTLQAILVGVVWYHMIPFAYLPVR